jgi:hypothetical protein
MSIIIFQIMAGLVLVSAALLLLGGILTMVRYPPRSPWDALPLTALVATLVVVEQIQNESFCCRPRVHFKPSTM